MVSGIDDTVAAGSPDAPDADHARTQTNAPGAPTGAAPSADPPAYVAGSLPEITASYYKIGEEIAHGGMGRIRAARDLRLGRDVAIKEVLRPTTEVALRFEREALLTARLQHPAIVAVYEAARWPSGEPFYAMKLVKGRSLKAAIASAETLDARLALLPHLSAVADAIAYAHGQQIIHRDLKPANVLVGDFGETVVIDWGLAKDLAAVDDDSFDRRAMPASRDSDLTIVGAVMGTPGYMSPEQARGESVDERADVYAIGALLYHLLAGKSPFHRTSTQLLLALAAEGAVPPIRELAPAAAPDLIAIVERAMARNLAARYPTARELADDLRRFQTGQLVASHRYTPRQLAMRFVRKHRGPLAVGAAAALALAILGVYSVQRIRDERDAAETARARATEAGDSAERARQAAERERATAVERADDAIIERAAPLTATYPHAALEALAALSADTKYARAARVVAADAFAHHAPRVYRGLFDDATLGALSPDGRLLAVATKDHAVKLYEMADLKRPPRVVLKAQATPWTLTWSARNNALAATSDRTRLQVYSLDTDTSISIEMSLGHESKVVLSDDGTRVAASCDSPETPLGITETTVWNAVTGERLLAVSKGEILEAPRDGHAVFLRGPTLRTLAFDTLRIRDTGIVLAPRDWIAAATDDGSALAIERANRSIDVVSLANHRVVRSLPASDAAGVTTAAFSRDGNTLFTRTPDRALRAWPLPKGDVRAIGVHEDWQAGGMTEAMKTPIAWRNVRSSPDGRTLLSTGSPGSLWDLESGNSAALAVPRSRVHTWAYLPSGDAVIGVVGADLWIWPVRSGARTLARNNIGGTADAITYFSGGHWLSALDDRIELDDGTRVPLPTHSTGRIAVSSDGQLAAMELADNQVRVFDLSTRQWRILGGALDATGRHATFYRADILLQSARRWMALSPDHSHLAAALFNSGHLAIWSLSDGARRDIDTGAAPIEQVMFTLDGLSLIAACADGAIHIYPIANGAERVFTQPGAVEAIAISPDGKQLATAGEDNKVRTWDLATAAARVRGAHTDTVNSIAFSPDGKWLASAGRDRVLRVEELATGRVQLIDGHTGIVQMLAFGPNGMLASADDNGVVRLTDVVAGRGRTLRSIGGELSDLTVSPDGTRIAAASQDGRVLEWTDDLPWDPAQLRATIADAAR